MKVKLKHVNIVRDKIKSEWIDQRVCSCNKRWYFLRPQPVHNKICQGSTLVLVSMAVLTSSLFLHPLSSAASLARQEHQESVHSEGPYRKKNSKAWLSVLSQKWCCIPATSYIRVAGYKVLSWQQASIMNLGSQHINGYIFCGILDPKSITPCTKHTDCPLHCLDLSCHVRMLRKSRLANTVALASLQTEGLKEAYYDKINVVLYIK